MTERAAPALPQFAHSHWRQRAAVEASVFVSSDLFDLAGARATASKYCLDRFWRNARTFASHDPTDAERVMIGYSELTGSSPFTVLLQALKGGAA